MSTRSYVEWDGPRFKRGEERLRRNEINTAYAEKELLSVAVGLAKLDMP